MVALGVHEWMGSRLDDLGLFLGAVVSSYAGPWFDSTGAGRVWNPAVVAMDGVAWNTGGRWSDVGDLDQMAQQPKRECILLNDDPAALGSGFD